MVIYAAVINELARAAGRCGMGAVMGSKNLKIIIAHGTQGVPVNDPEQFGTTVVKASKMVGTTPLLERNRLYGSAGIILPKQIVRESVWHSYYYCTPHQSLGTKPERQHGDYQKSNH